MNETKTATLVHGPWQGVTERCLWKTSDGEYIVTSSTTLFVFETLAFLGEPDGSIADLMDVGKAAYGDHRGAIESAGYEVVADG